MYTFHTYCSLQKPYRSTSSTAASILMVDCWTNRESEAHIHTNTHSHTFTLTLSADNNHCLYYVPRIHILQVARLLPHLLLSQWSLGGSALPWQPEDHRHHARPRFHSGESIPYYQELMSATDATIHFYYQNPSVKYSTIFLFL